MSQIIMKYLEEFYLLIHKHFYMDAPVLPFGLVPQLILK
jgi:hypothetical protein